MKYRLLLILSCLALCISVSSKEKKPKVDKVSTILKDAKNVINNMRGQAVQNANVYNQQKGALEAVHNRALAAAVREDVSNSKRCQLYYTAAIIDESMNDADNRRAYLKQAYDSAHFFTTLLNMYRHLELCDSVDHVPNDNGYAHPHYIRKTSALRSKHRRNILNGGKYFLIKGNYDQAFRFFDAYYQYRPEGQNPDIAKVVLWATECSYATKNYTGTLRYVDEAIKMSPDEVKPILQEYKVETYRQLDNDSLRFASLQEGVSAYPSHDYFFVNLVDWHYDRKEYDAGARLCDTLLAQYPESSLYWYAKSRFAMATEDFSACVAYADSALARQPENIDAHYNRGMAYVRMAILAQEMSTVDMHNRRFLSDRLHIKTLYSEALPSMEYVRQHEPENKERWASALYRIYLNLNMGKEFDEIDKLMHQ